MGKVLFIQKLFYEFIGTELLAATLEKEGHSTELIMCSGNKPPKKEILSSAPDLIAFSCTTGISRWAVQMARDIRQFTGAPIAMGGPHATIHPQTVLEDSIDMLCRGEGEKSFVLLMNSLDRAESITDTPNFVFEEDGKVVMNDPLPLEDDIDGYPFLNRHIYYNKYSALRIHPRKPFMSGRVSCKFNCAYCHNYFKRLLYKNPANYVQLFSVDRLIEEIEFVKLRYGLRTAEFRDEIFGHDSEWLKKFCEKFSQLEGSPSFACTTSANFLTEDNVMLMKEARCEIVWIGVETGSEEIRVKVLSKPIKNKHIVDAARILKKNGIKFGTFNILGFPGQGIEEGIKTIIFNASIKPDFPWATIFQPYPELPLTRKADEMGILPADYLERITTSFYFKSVLVGQEYQQAANLQKVFVLLVKFPGLLPFVRPLLKYPKNPLFDFIFCAGWILKYLVSGKMTPKHIIRNLFGFISYIKA